MNEPPERSEGATASRPRIVVAIDFSEDSAAALLWACRYAEKVDGELALLHVVHDPASSPGFYRRTADALYRPMHAVAETMMAEFLERFGAHHPGHEFLAALTPYFVPGLPPTRIVEVAGLLDAALIVVGNRGLTGLPHRLLGSTSERVVEMAPMPVVVVKSEDFGQLDKKARKRREKRRLKEQKRLRELLGLKPADADDEADD
jgi:nucleotide-binding universal stress UspA family protein